MNTTPLAKQVADSETRLKYLTLKSDADANTIDILKRQNHEQARSLERLTNTHSIELQKLRQERDEAVAKKVQVEGIISSICQLGLDGLARLADRSFISEEAEMEELANRIPDRAPDPAPAIPYAPSRRVDASDRQAVRRLSDPQVDHELLPASPLFLRGAKAAVAVFAIAMAANLFLAGGASAAEYKVVNGIRYYSSDNAAIAADVAAKAHRYGNIAPCQSIDTRTGRCVVQGIGFDGGGGGVGGPGGNGA